MMLIEIAQYLQDAGIGLSRGNNMFLSTMPNTPNIAVVLEEYSGQSPEFVHDNTQIEIDRPLLSILVRGEIEDYQSARTIASNIYKKLNHIVNESLNGVWYLRVTATGNLNDL